MSELRHDQWPTTGTGGGEDPHRGEAGRAGPASGENSLAKALGIVGDEWNLLILRSAFLGATRFGQWRERLHIPNSVLTSRLAKLGEAGLFESVRYNERPPRFEHRLTPAGTDLWRFMLMVWRWEAKWSPDDVRLPRLVRHRSCRQYMDLLLGCETCHIPVGFTDVRGTFGPSGSYQRSISHATTRRRPVHVIDTGPGGPGLLPDTIAVIGNRWTPAILANAIFGARRFSDFVERLGAPPAIVADRLKNLCQLGMLEPAGSEDDHPARGYELTEKGLSFYAPIVLMATWADQWFADVDGPAVIWSHTTCGTAFRPTLLCSVCEETVSGDGMLLSPNPG